MRRVSGDKQNLSGIILAGGRGERMGGAFKPLLSFRGRPLLAYSIDALAPLCDEILVMAGPRAAEVSRVAGGARVLADPGGGPHVALRLGGEAARGERLLVAPADAPFLTPAAYRALLAAGPNAVAIEGRGVNPLVGVYDRFALLEAMDGARSLQDVVTRLGALPVETHADLRDIDDPATFEDLR